MRHYEVVAVIHPDQQGRITAMIDLYKKIITDGGGVLHRLEDWGRRPLAYPIQNQHKAQYVLMNIECKNETLDKLRESFRFSDSIIRSLVVRREKAITEDSVIKRKLEEEASEKAAAAKSAAAVAAASAAATANAAGTDNATKPAAPADSPPAQPKEEEKSAAAPKSAAPAEEKTEAAPVKDSAPDASKDSPQPKDSEQ